MGFIRQIKKIFEPYDFLYHPICDCGAYKLCPRKIGMTRNGSLAAKDILKCADIQRQIMER